MAIEIDPAAEIGPGLRVFHGQGLVINGDATLGSRVTIRHSTTIGNRLEGGGSPKIGDDVEIGAHTIIIGEISIGSRAIIGAGSLVIDDVRAGDVVGGVPAKSLRDKKNASF